MSRTCNGEATSQALINALYRPMETLEDALNVVEDFKDNREKLRSAINQEQNYLESRIADEQTNQLASDVAQSRGAPTSAPLWLRETARLMRTIRQQGLKVELPEGPSSARVNQLISELPPMVLTRTDFMKAVDGLNEAIKLAAQASDMLDQTDVLEDMLVALTQLNQSAEANALALKAQQMGLMELSDALRKLTKDRLTMQEKQQKLAEMRAEVLLATKLNQVGLTPDKMTKRKALAAKLRELKAKGEKQLEHSDDEIKAEFQQLVALIIARIENPTADEAPTSVLLRDLKKFIESQQPTTPTNSEDGDSEPQTQLKAIKDRLQDIEAEEQLRQGLSGKKPDATAVPVIRMIDYISSKVQASTLDDKTAIVDNLASLKARVPTDKTAAQQMAWLFNGRNIGRAIKKSDRETVDGLREAELKAKAEQLLSGEQTTGSGLLKPEQSKQGPSQPMPVDDIDRAEFKRRQQGLTQLANIYGHKVPPAQNPRRRAPQDNYTVAPDGSFGVLHIDLDRLDRKWLFAKLNYQIVADTAIDVDLYDLLTKKRTDTKRHYSAEAVRTFKNLVSMAGLPLMNMQSKKATLINGGCMRCKSESCRKECQKGSGVKFYQSTDELIERLHVIVGSIGAGTRSDTLVAELSEILDVLKSKQLLTESEYRAMFAKHIGI